jgi:hypothetical protein
VGLALGEIRDPFVEGDPERTFVASDRMARFDVNRPFTIATLGLAVGAAIKAVHQTGSTPELYRGFDQLPTCLCEVTNSLQPAPLGLYRAVPSRWW